MLRNVSDIAGCRIGAVDGEIGAVRELYFDDASWHIRYLVVDTGRWLSGRQVLLSPVAIRQADWMAGVLSVDLTREQVQNSPDISTDQPISRQKETEYHLYYGWPYYWTLPMEPMLSPTPGLEFPVEPEPAGGGDPHLRSTREITGYHLLGRDGEVGHVEDFVVDDARWNIAAILVDTRHWWPGRPVAIPPAWIRSIRWAEREVHVDLSRDEIKSRPEFQPEQSP
jgi:uncharacterized protein YrrD